MTVVANFQYDAFGRRTGKTVSGTETRFLYDGLNPVQELTGTPPTPITNSLAGGVDDVFIRTDAAGARNFLADALGSTLALTDPAGSVLARYTYEPFGTTTVTGSAFSPYQYTGRENDGTGLYYYRARYYNSTLQRFISEDPIGFAGGINLYPYVLNNPLNWIDPEGLDVTVSLYPGARGFGHVGVGVNTNQTSGFYPMRHSTCLVTGCDVPGALSPDNEYAPEGTIVIHTTPAQDQAMQDVINQRNRNPGDYNLYGRNCAQFAEDVLRAGGLDPLDTKYPRRLFRDLRHRYGQR